MILCADPSSPPSRLRSGAPLDVRLDSIAQLPDHPSPPLSLCASMPQRLSPPFPHHHPRRAPGAVAGKTSFNTQ